MTISPKVRTASTYEPPPDAQGPCQISKKCTKSSTGEMQSKPGPPDCASNDLGCICGKDPSMDDNTLFDSHCLFQECTDTLARQAFMAAFSMSCLESKQDLQNIPNEWKLFVRSDISGNTPTVSNSDSLTTSSSTGVVSTSAAHPTILTTTMTKPEATVVSSTTSASSTTTDPIDYAKPICAITESCLVDQNSNDPCKLENLKCVCKFSNSLGSSTYFDQDCLWKNCINTRGRTEWLEAFAAACMDDKIPILDIPSRWQVLMPAWYANTTSTSTSISISAAPSSTTSISAVDVKPVILSEGVIAGIVVGSLAALALFLSLSCWAWRNHKKAKRKSRENATLADAINPHGVAARIDEITHGSPQHASIHLDDRTKSPLQPAPNMQHDFYGNLIPRRSSDQYGYIPPINPTMSELSYHTNPTYNPTPSIVEEHYIPDAIPAPLNIRSPLNASNLRTQNATPIPRHQIPDVYEAYKPRALSRSDSRRPRPKQSQDSMGTTAVTASPVQRYSADGFGRAEYDDFGQKIIYR
ncbi:hypothetical protein HBH56_000790 [Parastagonospora nodorum]|uniref:Uncharacterized protein n=1 Tax=Phaeosphaeria nodorum (strain SN15 / ATCC MYA-4574 / FGSC 10173) TaxID=321614 RepID=A0A7U2ENG6_PHANO|nr:hypothetical protein HBH56_000790 [Parastagonospora nodorum]QRC90081.1 hypothetical protein JI435_094990 [Parastagonospora nodorum SN15]KAH3937753.1 hypothetical protein HBH54_000800 [Parastagonospora nodorum]KAH4145623.1 hypothetical protein HBH45_011720 [Parastagonospora nodorum]KAH4164268.1 hypothetical protein HBH44_072760 [Parastagonospora nodorum]